MSPEPRSSSNSIQLSQPDIAYFYPRRVEFRLDANQAGAIVRGGRIVVDVDRHELSIDKVKDDRSTGDDFVFVPPIALHLIR